MGLARLLRNGDLTAVWVPDPEREALCDLVRARYDAKDDLRGLATRWPSSGSC